MNNASFEQELQEKIDNLSQEKQPQRDLWRGIEQALEQDPPKQKTYSRPIYAVAASVCVVSFVGWLSFSTGKVSSGNELVAQLSQQHEAQKQALLVQFQNQPSATEDWQTQLAELDKAAEAIKKALVQEPNNPALLKMLGQVYEKQMNLIERVHAPSWQRI